MRAHVHVLLAASLTMTMLPSAAAKPERVQRPAMKETARVHLELGLRLYTEGNFNAAAAEFRAGIKIDPHPDFFYALGQAERSADRCDAAIVAFEAFLRAQPPDAEAAKAQRNIDRCRLSQTPGPRAGSRTGPDPAPRASPVSAAVRDQGEAGHRVWYRDWWGNSLVLSGALAAGVGTVFLVRGNRHARAANQAETFDVFGRERDAAASQRLVGGLVLGVGGALVLAGALRYALLPRGETVSVSYGPTSGGLVMSVEARF